MIISLQRTRRLAAAAAVVGTVAAAAVMATSAGATTASATLTAGSLGFVTVPNVTFPSTPLTGVNQALTAAQPIDIGDATGSGAGWNITATSTQFSGTGSITLPDTAVAITSAPATPTCDASSTCTPATAAAGVTYPYTLPAATTAPPATKMFSATAGTGLGDQTLTPTWTLTIPSDAKAGTYTSTWTLSIVSGP